MLSTFTQRVTLLSALLLFFYLAVCAQDFHFENNGDSAIFNVSYVSGRITVKTTSHKTGDTKESVLSKEISSKQDCAKLVTDEVLQQLSKRIRNMSPSLMEYNANNSGQKMAQLYFPDGWKKLEKITFKGVGDITLFVLNGAYTISITDEKTAKPADIVVKEDEVYKFKIDVLKNYPAVLPKMLGMAQKYKENFSLPGIYLLPSRKLFIPTMADSSITLSKTVFTAIQGNKSDASLTLCTKCSVLYEIKTEAVPASGTQTPDAVKTVSKSVAKEELIIPERKFECDSPFALAAYTYPAAIDDSFNLVMYMSMATNKQQQILFSNTCMEAVFTDAVLSRVSADCRTNVKPAVELYYRDLQAALRQRSAVKKQNEIRAEVQQEYATRIAQIAGEKGFAAKLTANKSVPVYTSENKVSCSQAETPSDNIQTDVLVIDSVHLEVRNDEIYQIDINGKMHGDTIKTISNDSYGITLRALLDGGNRISFNYHGKTYWLCYAKVFQVNDPPVGVIKYEIQDGEYAFNPGDPTTSSQLLAKKQLLDYFSASAFLDVLAFNQTSSNKNLVTELYFNYYWNKMNIKQGFGMLKNVYMPVTFGLNLFKQDNGAMETARVPVIMRIDSTGGVRDTISTHKYYFKNLDLLRNSFMQLNPMLNILAWDNKKLRSIYELNGGFLLMGSNATLVDPAKGVDSVYSKSVYSYSWMLETRVRFKPTAQFGLDLHVGYSFGLRPFNLYMKSVTGDYDVKDLARANMLNVNRDDLIKGELNIFFNPHTRPSDTNSGGVYFKLNWFKSVYYPDGHFMFLLGYSTDVNNFFR